MSEIYHAVIVDDDEAAIAALKQEIQLFVEGLSVIGSAHSIKEAVELIDKMKPDIVLLDIQLKEGLGFDVLEQASYTDYHLIFTTAYNQYALDAFKVSAFDYLLKPVNGAELEATIQRLKESGKAEATDLGKNEHGKIVLTSAGEIMLFDPDEILRCTAVGNYSQFHLLEGSKVLTSKTLKETEGILDSPIFLRVHKSHIVNLKLVKAFNTKENYLVLKDESQIPVSQRKKATVIKHLKG